MPFGNVYAAWWNLRAPCVCGLTHSTPQLCERRPAAWWNLRTRCVCGLTHSTPQLRERRPIDVTRRDAAAASGGDNHRQRRGRRRRTRMLRRLLAVTALNAAHLLLPCDPRRPRLLLRPLRRLRLSPPVAAAAAATGSDRDRDCADSFATATDSKGPLARASRVRGPHAARTARHAARGRGRRGARRSARAARGRGRARRARPGAWCGVARGVACRDVARRGGDVA